MKRRFPLTSSSTSGQSRRTSVTDSDAGASVGAESSAEPVVASGSAALAESVESSEAELVRARPSTGSGLVGGASGLVRRRIRHRGWAGRSLAGACCRRLPGACCRRLGC